jgi:hypothetical protein
MQYYTPEQYILKSLGEYPTLYSQPTYDQVRLSVLDHILNTIGNGINDIDEFHYQEYDFVSAKKFITDETLYYGYYADDCITKFIGPTKEPFITHKVDAKPIVVVESDRETHSDIADWVKCSRYAPDFYRNFIKKYSTVHAPWYSGLGSEWIKEAIWFYQQALEYFENEQSSSYSSAFPNTSNIFGRMVDTTDRLLTDFSNRIKQYESYAAISEAYGVEYTGDDYDFLCRRWQNELSRIKTFTNDTIKMLELKL